MSFNVANFSQMNYGAGSGIWFYNSSDNLASQIIGVIEDGYFVNAYKNHGIPVRAGDLIIHSNYASKLVCHFIAYADFNATNASVVKIAGPNVFP